MKATILNTFALLAAMSISAHAGLAAHFKFNDTLTDETGQHNGTSTATPAFDAGKDGDALTFDTADSAVELANPQTLDFGKDFSVAAWVQTTAGGEQVVIYRGDPAHFDTPALQFNVQGSKFFLYGADQGFFTASFADVSVNDGEWHHLAMTYSVTGTNHLTLYLDGNPERAGDPGATGSDFMTKSNAPNSVVRIGGRDTDSPDYHFRGMIDDVQIYDRTLAPDQVQFLAANPGAVVQPPALPSILTQPQTNVVVALGGTAVFTVVAEAATPLTYKWMWNGNALSGQTNATLTLTNVTAAQAGPYTVVVSSTAGDVTSTPAVLVVGGKPELSLHMYAGITLMATPGLNYRVEYQDALAPPDNWVTLTNLTLTTSPYLVFDVQSTNSVKRFYRAVAVP